MCAPSVRGAGAHRVPRRLGAVRRPRRLHRYASQGDEPLRRGAKALLTAVPGVASAALRIEVLAPMLVVRERVTRDQAMLALWPDADADSG